MRRYREYSPTGFDIKGLNADSIGPDDSPDVSDWLVAPCGKNRDSGILTESNWETLRKLLRAADPEERDHFVAGFNHWACGWLEIILVRPDSSAARVAEEAESSLSDYPILSESDYSEREWEAVREYWSRSSVRERLEMIRESRGKVSPFAARRDELPDDPDGRFSEYISVAVQSYN